MGQQKTAPAQGGEGALGDTGGKGRCDRCIKGIAPLAQHLGPGLGSEGVARCDRAPVRFRDTHSWLVYRWR